MTAALSGNIIFFSKLKIRYALVGLYQIPAFSQEYKVITSDNRDVGRSSKATRPYTIADMADDFITPLFYQVCN